MEGEEARRDEEVLRENVVKFDLWLHYTVSQMYVCPVTPTKSTSHSPSSLESFAAPLTPIIWTTEPFPASLISREDVMWWIPGRTNTVGLMRGGGHEVGSGGCRGRGRRRRY